jgi:hypothetical protein
VLLWGAPRIHGELLTLGFEIAQSSVAKYMVEPPGPPSQGWRTFLRNHAPDIAAMGLFQLSVFRPALCLRHRPARPQRARLDQRHSNPTAEWVARQITEAFPWDEAPHYLIRDRDRIYGSVVTRRLRAMDVPDKPTAPVSPWQTARFWRQPWRECGVTGRITPTGVVGGFVKPKLPNPL